MRSHPSLDLLRGLAAISVLLFHVRGSSFVDYAALPLDQRDGVVMAFYAATRLGHEALLVFFVLSGYLVGGRILSRVREGSFSLPAYAGDRARRILPPLFAACAFTAVVDGVFLGRHDPLTRTVGNALGLNGVVVATFPVNHALWSIAYEIWFYVMGGVVGYLLSRRRTDAHPAMFVALFAVLCVFSALSPRYLLYWALGAFATLLRARSWEPVAAAVMLIVGAGLWQSALPSTSALGPVLATPELAETFICAGVFLVLPWLAREETARWLRPLGSLPAALAAISYSLYLFHLPTDAALDLLFARADRVTAASMSVFALRLAICVAVATCAWWLVERRTRKPPKIALPVDDLPTLDPAPTGRGAARPAG